MMSLSTFWTGLTLVCSVIAIAVCQILGHPVPTLINYLAAGLAGGHLALASPTSPSIVSSAAPRAPPAASGAAVPGSVPLSAVAPISGPAPAT